MVKDSLRTPQPSQYDAESTLAPPSVACSVDGYRGQEEGLQTISLSSDEDGSLAAQHLEGDDMLMYDEPGSSRRFERRAEKFKRNSLKKVDSLKKAFSRQSIEKKVNEITTKIVPPEKREKIKKSLTPHHPKSPTAKSTSFKVNPLTFNVKKNRDGETPTEEIGSPGEGAVVEIPPLDGLDGQNSLAEVHIEEGVLEASPSTPESLKAELAINGENGEPPITECEINERCAGLAIPENIEDVGEEEEEEEEEHEKNKSVVETTADTQIPAATISVEPVS